MTVARNTTLIVKQGFIEIGDHCSIGSETLIGVWEVFGSVIT